MPQVSCHDGALFCRTNEGSETLETLRALMWPMIIPFSTALNRNVSGPEVNRSICRSKDSGVIGGLKRRFVTGDCNGFRARSWIWRPLGMSEAVKGRISKGMMDRIALNGNYDLRKKEGWH